MDELPREARELLALAQDAHDPPDNGARDRVRRGVLMAAAAGGGAVLASKAVASAAGSAVTGAAKTGMFASASAKLLLAGSALVVASAVTVVAPRLSQPSAKETTHEQAHAKRQARPHAKVERTSGELEKGVQAEGPSAPTANLQIDPALAAQAVAGGAHALLDNPPSSEEQPLVAAPRVKPASRLTRERTRKATQSSLEAEMKLLQGASDAIAAQQIARARGLLNEHRKVYPHGQLSVEREGLLTLAQCTQGGAQSQTRARNFLRVQPGAVLAARIRSACNLDEKP